uniref:Product n=1 Tax=Wildemania schizophylla TaxID=1134705 RepID=A0A126G2D2_WILSC|nr:product [Wildemania schizophylla]AKS28525.1 product [Wildemania schizophylla]
MPFNFALLSSIKFILPSQININLSVPLVWKVILLGDGSFTRHCNILTYTNSTIRHISTVVYTKTGQSLKSYINRKVWIGTNRKEKLILASSWWNSKEYQSIFKSPSKAIGVSLIHSEVDFYRDLHGVFLGYSQELENLFLVKGPFWGRYYTLFHKGKPISIIYEIFSPLLETVK